MHKEKDTKHHILLQLEYDDMLIYNRRNTLQFIKEIVPIFVYGHEN